MLCKIIGAHVVKNLLKTTESQVVYLGIQNDNSKSTFLWNMQLMFYGELNHQIHLVI